MNIAIVIAFSGLFFSCAHKPIQPADVNLVPPKKYDLVLVHGLANKHRWGDAFIETCLNIWGSGNVYVVYTNESKRVWTRTIHGKELICIGEDDHSAGKESIEVQAERLAKALALLEKEHGLSSRFSIIAHSMGGLVTRYYIYKNPGRVAGLVTLGTPHHGSPLADSFSWTGKFIGAGAAIDNLRPDFVEAFNRLYPATGAPLHKNGRIYTIRGRCPKGACFGWGGELHLGWNIMRTVNHTDSDGLVPTASAVIEGTDHLGDFDDFDHYELVQEPEVALTAARPLP